MNKATNKALLAKLDELVEQVKLMNAILVGRFYKVKVLLHCCWEEEKQFGNTMGNRIIPVAVYKPTVDVPVEEEA